MLKTFLIYSNSASITREVATVATSCILRFNTMKAYAWLYVLTVFEDENECNTILKRHAWVIEVGKC